MQKSCTDVDGIKMPTARICDGDEDANSVERDCRGKSSEVINAKFLAVPACYEPALVFL